MTAEALAWLVVILGILLHKPIAVGTLRARLPAGPSQCVAWLGPLLLWLMAARSTGLLQLVGIGVNDSVGGLVLCGLAVAFVNRVVNPLRRRLR